MFKAHDLKARAPAMQQELNKINMVYNRAFVLRLHGITY